MIDLSLHRFCRNDVALGDCLADKQYRNDNNDGRYYGYGIRKQEGWVDGHAHRDEEDNQEDVLQRMNLVQDVQVVFGIR